MDINNENINLFLNKYVEFVNNLCIKHNYPVNIKHVLYLIVPAFVMKYGIKEERNILSCFEKTPIHIDENNDSLEKAYFNRRICSTYEGGNIKYYAQREIVINGYRDISLLDLIDSIVHEFNHAVNSIINEIKWNNDEVSLRTGLAYIHFYRDNINKVKSRSKNIMLEEIINTTQTESIINIINSFNNYEINNEEIKNTLYSLKHNINTTGYESSAYYFQNYICKALMKNKTFIPTIENLRYKGNVEDIENWFDNITNIRGSYNKMINLLEEMFNEEKSLQNVKLFRKYKINKIIEKSKKVLDIILMFDSNCIYK